MMLTRFHQPWLRKTVTVVLTIVSILFALGSMLSHWHPIHVSDVWEQGVQRLDLRGGGVRWFYEAQRDQCQAYTVWTSSDHFLPGGLGFRTTSYGTTVAIPGVIFQWCRQPTGYRRFVVEVDFFKLALLAALYPAISMSMLRVRHVVRRRRGLCIRCGYNLEGNVSGVCSECGTEFER